MTSTPTPPPAGWYRAPDGSSATWWWDGGQWTQPQPQQQPGRQAGTHSLARLATATQVLLVVCGVLSIITIGIETFGIGAVNSYLDGHGVAVDMLTVYDQSRLVLTILSGVSLLATGVLWVIWQYRAAKQVAGLTRRSAGWHAGSWFVPVVSLWFPYQDISDLWRVGGRVRPPWQVTWWVLWLVSSGVTQISSRIYLAAEELEQLRNAMWVSILGESLLLAATPLAWLIVRGITQGILERSSVPARMLAV
ncbi:DUF4328 domain-containing protein [Microbacterium terricola]|uniref:DUF4328 domain-containing protein n=1 Tax=Microbacterium terricola TaxID=344163 RepID=A0ABM8E1V0_9MICO|nr:DUF4328 domain-containing protein [Microbacterium terricola]UYK40362.1 DUF4328 domain-containing protein [Microbacterium terricola]BDV31924.1 hypothetical protein Microterr_25840 [Microbacterium terricola]